MPRLPALLALAALLTPDATGQDAESRLRSARLYTEDVKKTGGAYLYLNVTVVVRAFGIWLGYNKLVTDQFGEPGSAPTWSLGSTGTLDGDPGFFIVLEVSQDLDRFLPPTCASTRKPAVAYPLRTPRAACDAEVDQPISAH